MLIRCCFHLDSLAMIRAVWATAGFPDDREITRIVISSVWSFSEFGRVLPVTRLNNNIGMIMPGARSLRCLSLPTPPSSTGLVAWSSRTLTSRFSDRRLTGDSGRESHTSEGGGVKGYSISGFSSSEQRWVGTERRWDTWSIFAERRPVK